MHHGLSSYQRDLWRDGYPRTDTGCSNQLVTDKLKVEVPETASTTPRHVSILPISTGHPEPRTPGASKQQEPSPGAWHEKFPFTGHPEGIKVDDGCLETTNCDKRPDKGDASPRLIRLERRTKVFMLRNLCIQSKRARRKVQNQVRVA